MLQERERKNQPKNACDLSLSPQRLLHLHAQRQQWMQSVSIFLTLIYFLYTLLLQKWERKRQSCARDKVCMIFDSSYHAESYSEMTPLVMQNISPTIQSALTSFQQE